MMLGFLTGSEPLNIHRTGQNLSAAMGGED